jgi:hypothetical protein
MIGFLPTCHRQPSVFGGQLGGFAAIWTDPPKLLLERPTTLGTRLAFVYSHWENRMAFTDIKIVGMDDQVSASREPHSAIVTITLQLSASAPSEWADYFNQAWKQHIYMMKRRAQVLGRSVQIECVPDELEVTHLPELKKVIGDTNQAYSKIADAQARQREAEAAREAATAATLKEIKGRIKFD